MSVLGAIDPADVLILLIAILGYVPMILSYRRNRTTWLFLAYTALVVAALGTFLEGSLPIWVTEVMEDGFATMFSILFFLSAYYSRLEIYSMKEADEEVFG